ncbi:MAG TPA: methyltransferase domain-containing protein [Bryobacteraceae bacterium]|nr:methyltransferase domain-containing protein [Bryobacteraceae bacterium]
MCPVCGGQFQATVAPAAELSREFDLQREFVLSRLPSTPSPEELKDLTDFMHGAPAPLRRCTRCGLVRRAELETEDASSYEEDPNDPDVMAQVYPRYVQAFRNKEAGFRPLLRPNADVIELGPHLGGFLQTAEEWNWRPVGVDVGADTTAFMRRNGLTVRTGLLEDVRLGERTSDALFIWNCFEQLLDPMETLRAAWRVLRKHGLLIVRVPNLAFYTAFRHSPGMARKALAYNNLLGFPYLYGYTPETLNRLLARAGFTYERGFNSELVTTPFADVSARIAREQRNVSQAVAEWSTRTSASTLTGPWIEAVYRRDPKAVPIPPAHAIDRRFMERAAA